MNPTHLDLADPTYAWLKAALIDQAWLSTQREAWEPMNKPESLGQPRPRFVQLEEQNPEHLLAQLATHFRQLAERHRATAQGLTQIAEAYAARH